MSLDSAEKSDEPISFKVSKTLKSRLESLADSLSQSDRSWRRPMSRHQAAKAIVMKVLNEPDFDIEKLKTYIQEG